METLLRELSKRFNGNTVMALHEISCGSHYVENWRVYVTKLGLEAKGGTLEDAIKKLTAPG